ncbi:MAG: excinuclease ABC subunit UvrA [Candidatus Moraniibacteriota bacterium]
MPASADKKTIVIKGARVNNLKNVDVEIPRESLVVITGLSGSGKSSLAFDTIYAEANRRYMESLSSYARNFLQTIGKPDVDLMTHLSPAISIDQRSISRSPRSTVGTLTEIYDYLRVLYAKAGEPHCPQCGAVLRCKQSREILEELIALPGDAGIVFLTKPVLLQKKTEKEALRQVEQWGYARVRFRGTVMLVTEALPHASDMLLSEMEVVVDRMTVDVKRPDKERIVDSLETAFKLGQGVVTILIDQTEERKYDQEYRCGTCQMVLPELVPNVFSFNAPEGACPTCAGLGVKPELNPELVLPNKNLSILEGAIRPWSKSREQRPASTTQFELLRDAAARHGFSLDIPVGRLRKRDLNVILYGELPEKFSEKMKAKRFVGVIPLLEKKYREAKSEHTRVEIEKYMLMNTCPVCEGRRLKPESLAVLFLGESISEMTARTVEALRKYVRSVLSKSIPKHFCESTRALLQEVDFRLDAMEKVGLNYLEIARGAETLSGGEAQRIKLAIQMKSDLTGILYVLDEPSIGLHSRDTEKLIGAMNVLKENGNSLIVVEHDPAIMRVSDWIVDMGPGAGSFGGEVVFSGTAEQLWKSKTLTGKYLSGRMNVAEPDRTPRRPKQFITITDASEHNLKHIDVDIPLECFVAITGVSGSGKSTLVHDILAQALARHFYGTKVAVGKHKKIEGLDQLDKVITVTQDPIGRTPRSNAATYTGLFTPIREMFAATVEAKKESFAPSHFSFNMRGGRCEMCQGGGVRKVEMYLLPDVYVPCEVCHGTRYNDKTLAIEYRGKNISQVLKMSVLEARVFFADQSAIDDKLRTLEEVGLGYLKLGQSATNLSGGEAQRIKLATELARKATGKTLYILDEPTIGLHFDDIRRLLLILDALIIKGNTVIVVEHNVDIIRYADWVIDMGPEGGTAGGEILCAGPPAKIRKCRRSYTGRYI